MSYIIPNQQSKKLNQTNKNDLSGNLFVSKNLNLDEEGYIKLSRAAIAIYTKDNDADFDDADSMFVSDEGLWMISDETFSMAQLNFTATATDHTTDTNSPSPGVEEDGTFFNETEVISDGTGIRYKSGATAWTIVALSLTSGRPTQMAVFDSFASLLVGNANKVHMVDTSWTETRTLTLPAEYDVTGIAINNNVAFIGTRHRAQGEAKLFLWDGTTNSHNGSFGVGTFEISSVVKYKSSAVLINSLGQLLRFTGGSFEELATLPVFRVEEEWCDSLNDHTKVSFKGMAVDGDVIYIRLDSELDTNINSYNPYFPGGVWCFDPNVGLYHRYSPSYSRVISDTILTSDVNTTTNVITVSTAPVTGTPVMYYSGGGTVLAGLTDYRVYYAINVSATTMKLASTLAEANAGTAIDLTGTGNNLQALYIFFMNDFGWEYAQNRGSIVMTPNTISNNNSLTGRLVFTANLWAKQNSSTDRTVLNTLNQLIENRGYLITPKLVSSSVKDNYKDVVVKYKPLGELDKLVIKYKTEDKYQYPKSSASGTSLTFGTWSSTTQFTTTYDLSSAVVGEEISIIAGVGAGYSAHITAISYNTGTYTVTLDEAFIYAASGDLFLFNLDNFVKIDTISSSNQSGTNYKTLPVDKNSKFVQVKVELRGIETTIEELQVTNSKYLGGRE